MIFAYPAINPRMPLRASLSRYNVPRTHDFPVPSLQPQILCVGIPPVTRRTTLLLRRKSRKNRAHVRVPTLQPLTRRARSRTETHERAHRRCDRAPRAARRCAREHGSPTNHASSRPRTRPCQSHTHTHTPLSLSLPLTRHAKRTRPPTAFARMRSRARARRPRTPTTGARSDIRRHRHRHRPTQTAFDRSLHSVTSHVPMKASHPIGLKKNTHPIATNHDQGGTPLPSF